MMTITFSKLRDSEDWGLRGNKETPDEQLPQEGTMVTVTKKSGEQQDVIMGRVVAQGDDWWLATTGASNNTATCRACACDVCVGLMAKLKQLVVDTDDQHDAAIPEGHPKPDANSDNYTERRLAREESDAIAERNAEPNRGDGIECGEERPGPNYEPDPVLDDSNPWSDQ